MHIALSRHAHDRIADRRVDEEWLAEVWADPATRVLVIAGTRFQLVDGRVPWVSPREAPEGTRVLLGDLDGVVHFAVIVAPELADEGWTGLRGVVAAGRREGGGPRRPRGGHRRVAVRDPALPPVRRRR